MNLELIKFSFCAAFIPFLATPIFICMVFPIGRMGGVFGNTNFYMHGFPYWEDGGREAPPPAENLLTHPPTPLNLEKPPNQIFISPAKFFCPPPKVNSPY